MTSGVTARPAIEVGEDFFTVRGKDMRTKETSTILFEEQHLCLSIKETERN